MRPVSTEFRISQLFGSGATAGIAPNKDPSSGWAYYVYLYGNYQPFGHAGLDIATPIGTPIYAIADGTVLYAGWSEDLPGAPNKIRKWLFYYNFGGKLTLIQHNGWISAVAHQSDNSHVKVGDRVKEGQLVGLSGNTKTRTSSVAAHIHIEALVHLDYRTDVRKGIIYGRVNPMNYFGGLAAQGTITTPATPILEEIDMAAEERLMAQLNQMVEWEDGRYQDLKGKIDATLGHAARAAQVAQATEDRGDSAKIAMIFQMLAQIAPQFRFFKGPNPDDKTLYELEGGVLRGITFAEWQAKGGAEPSPLEQEDLDKLLKAGK